MNTTIDGVEDLDRVWSAALAILKEQVPEPSYRTWLDGTHLSELKGNDARTAVAVVAVPSAFAAEWLQHRYATVITDALSTCVGHLVGLSFTIEAVRSRRAIRALDGVPPLALKTQVEAQHPIAVGQSRSLSPIPGPLQARSRSNAEGVALQVQASGRVSESAAGRVPVPVLNPRYTFDQYLVGRSNQLGASAARRVAEEPGQIYNPLFIYGFHGVGKTHLLHAIGNDAYSRGRSRVLCIPATLFDNHAVASRLVGIDAPNQIDLLLVDDLHSIAGASGRAAQRWMEMLVEAMLAAGKGVVVTAAQPPDSMLAMRDVLRSRFGEGMVVALELPDAEMRLRMAGHLAQRAATTVAQDALQLLASSGKTMTQLRSLWEKVIAGCGPQALAGSVEAVGRTVTVQELQAVLATVEPATALRTRIGPERIIDQVASYFDLEVNEMCSSSRERRIMIPRQIAMYLIREQTDYSYEWIAHRFARRDHTTAMHSCGRVQELSETNPEVRQTVLELRQMIYGEHEPHELVHALELAS